LQRPREKAANHLVLLQLLLLLLMIRLVTQGLALQPMMLERAVGEEVHGW
jgi:hypothetical protein